MFFQNDTHRLVHPFPNDPTKVVSMVATGEDWYHSGGWETAART
jgi:hypothetical protein